MHFVPQLTDFIDQRWRQRNYDELAFSHISEEALREVKALEAFQARDMFEWTAREPFMPPQEIFRDISDFRVRLFDSSRYTIELYFWIDGTTTLHSHEFHGAFRVMVGSSLHSVYRFEERRRINSVFRVGTLHLQKAELLETGDVRQVNPKKWAHSLFHLDRPSITLVTRSKRDLENDDLFTYYQPGLAVCPHLMAQELIRQQHALRALHQAEVPGLPFEGFLRELLSSVDLYSAARLLELAADLRKDPGLVSRMLALLRERHGEVVDVLPPALQAVARERKVLELRKVVKDPEQRFLLALLANIPGWPPLLDLLRRRYPGQPPEETARRLLGKLAAGAPLGLTEAGVAAFVQMAAGKPEREVREAVERCGGAPPTDAELRALCDGVRRSDLLGRYLAA